MKRLLNLAGSKTFRLTVLVLPIILSACANPGKDSSTAAALSAVSGPSYLIRTNYHGWANAIVLSNGHVEAIIVPEIGRIMQFRLVGQEVGPFWENGDYLGKMPDPTSTNWMNFGGDKAWPSPMSGWASATGHFIPPPSGFDAASFEAAVDGWVVTLTSPVDRDYGIKVQRVVEMVPDQPTMVVRTTFEKVRGDPTPVGILVATQLKPPIAVASPILDRSIFRDGFKSLSEEIAPTLTITDDVIAFARNPKANHRIGTDAGMVFWIDHDQVLKIESPRIPYATYPDDGSSVEIFAAANDLGPYVELETLSPLRKMVPGDKIEHGSTYTLLPRTEVDPELEVQMILARRPR